MKRAFESHQLPLFKPSPSPIQVQYYATELNCSMEVRLPIKAATAGYEHSLYELDKGLTSSKCNLDMKET
jgi:hypothetical protein